MALPLSEVQCFWWEESSHCDEDSSVPVLLWYFRWPPLSWDLQVKAFVRICTGPGASSHPLTSSLSFSHSDLKYSYFGLTVLPPRVKGHWTKTTPVRNNPLLICSSGLSKRLPEHSRLLLLSLVAPLREVGVKHPLLLKTQCTSDTEPRGS